MKSTITFLILFLFSTSIFCQSTLELTFSAIDNTTQVQFDSVKIKNLTQDSDTTLVWPDSVLIFYITGLEENSNQNNDFQVFQNFPNPVLNKTNVNISLPENGSLYLALFDILGRQLLSEKFTLDKGGHNFILTPGKQDVYFLTAVYKDKVRTIKIINNAANGSNICNLSYLGSSNLNNLSKNTEKVEAFMFNVGDQLLFVAYKDSLESGAYDSPMESTTYPFQFATNIPCPDMPTFEYEGQVYNTIQVCNQCWMKENLNVGIMITPPEMQTNNDIIEKYCMANESWICDSMGGLYFWNELMNYSNQNGGKGICPDGWHVPTDLEWQILEGAVDSEYGIGSSEWERVDWRGSDAGGSLKDDGSYYWEPPNTGATDLYGVRILPGGYFVQGDFWGPGWKGMYWSSDIQNKYFRNMDADQKMIKKQEGGSGLAISVRCIKDQNYSQNTPPIYLLGNGTTVDWDNTKALPMAWIGEGHFARVETFTPGEDHYLKFISNLGMWAPQWGTDDTGTPQEGPLVYRPTENNPDPEAIPVGDVEGDFYIEVDTANLQYFTDLTSGELFVLGSATTVGWEQGEAIQMNQDTPHVFSIELPLYADGGLKFIEKLGSWYTGWGTDENGTSTDGTIGRWPSLSSEMGDYNEDLPGPETEGLYLITVDMRTMEYTIVGR